MVDQINRQIINSGGIVPGPRNPADAHQAGQPMPKLSSPVVNVDGTLSIPWYRLFITLWQRTGGVSGDTDSDAGIPEAPTDGQVYGRANSSWTPVVESFNGRTGVVTLALSDVESAGGAPIDSPDFTGDPTAPTLSLTDNSNALATTAFVNAAIAASGGGGGVAGVSSWNGRAGAVTMTLLDVTGVGGAPIASPGFTGSPTGPTPTAGDNSTKLATTAFVDAAIAAIPPPATGVTSFNTRTGAVTLVLADVTGVGGAPLASPGLTGSPTAPTPTVGDNSTKLATTAFVTSAVANVNIGVASFNSRTGVVTLTLSDVTSAGGAPLASPALTGTPTAPTAVAGTNTTQLATTAFVGAAISAIPAGVTSFNTRTGAVTLALADVTGVGGATVAQLGNYLPLAGGTLTGALTLAADPTVALGAATKQYVDAHTGGGADFPLNAAVLLPSNQTATTLTTSGGSVYLKMGNLAPSSSYPNALVTFYINPTNLSAAVVAGTGVNWWNNLWVMWGANGIYTSPDGVTWTNRITGGFFNVAYNGSIFVATLSTVSATNYYTSPDGITWTVHTLPTNLQGFGPDVAYCSGAGRFVMVANGSGTSNYAYSTDGLTWTQATLPASGTWTITANATTFVISNSSGGIGVAPYTSTTGTSWTARTSPYSTGTFWVQYVGSLFFAGGTAAGSNFATSPDGITWTAGGPMPLVANDNFASSRWTLVYTPSPSPAYLWGTSAVSTNGTAWTTGAQYMPNTTCAAWNGTTLGMFQGSIFKNANYNPGGYVGEVGILPAPANATGQWPYAYWVKVA